MDDIRIMLVACDTLRADHLGCYGYFRNTTPNLDKIAREGILFEDFFCSGAPTGPSFTSLYTGLYPINHKYYHFGKPDTRQIENTINTMPEILNGIGYITAAIDNLINFRAHSAHWVRGYNFYINPSKASDYPYEITAREVNNQAVSWIQNHSDEKFFLFVHYWDPHLWYNPPEEYRKMFHHEKGDLSDLEIRKAPAKYRYISGWGKTTDFVEGEITLWRHRVSIDLYDSEIAYMDHAIGKVVATLEEKGILDDTLVIVFSDHGENLMQHYHFWDHNSLHDTIIHVPLLMRCPRKVPKNIRVKGLSQHIDILPTILDLVGAPTDSLRIDGKSMLPLLEGEQIRDKIFVEHTSGQRAIRTAEWKLIADEWTRTPQRELELYNLENDPIETINLAANNEKMVRGMKERLHEWVKCNIKDGELDPAIYEEKTSMEYRQRTNLLDNRM